MRKIGQIFRFLIPVIALVALVVFMTGFGRRKSYKLVYHQAFPPGYISAGDVYWMDEVERQTEGRVTFTRIFGGTLGDLGAQPLNLQGGVFDVGQISYVYSPGLYPLGTVCILPFVATDVDKWMLATHELLEHPAIVAEYEALNQKALFSWCLEPMELMSYVEVYSIDDLRGLKIRGHGGSAWVMEAAGLTVVAVPWDEFAVAAERRVVDAGSFPVPLVGRDAGLHQIFPYYITDLPFYNFHFATAINFDTWNKLPADIQEVMLEVAAEMTEYNSQCLYAELEKGLQDLLDAGVVTLHWPPEELEKFREIALEKVWPGWVAEREAEGLPAQEILEHYQALVEKY